jgi:signal transduction histidine kinase
MTEQLVPPTEQSLRRLRWQTALAGALTFAIPFALFVVLDFFASETSARRSLLLYVSPFLLLGVLLAIILWKYTMNLIARLAHDLTHAALVARQRENERDRAVQQLARRLEEERELAREKSEFQSKLAEYEKYAALSQLALGAAHEINNPLLGLLSHLELERKHARNDELLEEIDQCIEGTRRIAAALRGLVNFARPGKPQLAPVILSHLVEEALAFLHHHPLFRNIELEAQIAPDVPALIADSNQLSQMLMNLVLNAAEAMPYSGGRIVIGASRLDASEQVEIWVEDNGRGITPDVLPHVFEPFFTTKKGKGTGLGLSITQAYLRNHGGDIRIESVPLRGTRVEITLPVTPQMQSQPLASPAEVIG